MTKRFLTGTRFFGRSSILGIRLAVVLVGSVLCLPTSEAQVPNNSPAATKFSRINEVVDQWRPDRHLFVKGELGIGPAQLDDLESWLDVNAPHWVIVLMNNASGESYLGADGSSYNGMDAVEHALGKGLNNRTDFGKFAHPQTGELDGKVFVLFLQERKFSYYASDAQNRRNLGESNWIGQLDQPAMRAMRSGGRILDAVKDTVKSIDQQLARMIGAEVADAERVKLELQRALESLRSSIAHSRTLIEEVKLASAQYRQNHSSATGPLVQPPIDQWLTEISTIEADASAGTVRDAQQRLTKTDDSISAYLNGYADALGLATQVQQITAKVETVSSTAAAAAPLADAKKSLEEAEKLVSNGDLGVAEELQKADAAIANGQAIAESERARTEREQLVQAWVRRTIVMMLVLAALIFAAMLWIMNLRRRAIMQKALATLDERELQVNTETEGIDRLFTRNDDLLGSKEKIAERGYVGATRMISEKAIDYVDDLFIMSKEVRRVLKEARELVSPGHPWMKILNLFSGGNYQQAVNLVTGKPLKFSRLNGLPWVLRERFAAESKSVTPKEMPDEITMTFDEVFQAFKQRGVDAESALSTVESCLTEVHETLSTAQADLQKCVTQDKRLESESGNDLYFNVPDYLKTLIPSIQDDLAEADKMSTFDAVGAMQGSLATARRKLTEATQLGEQLLAARQKIFPQLRQAADKLRELRFTSQWIDSELVAITTRANELMKAAVERSIATDSKALGGELAALVMRSEEAVQIATRIRQELHPEGVALRSRNAGARRKLAQQLSLPESDVLHEADRSPDEHWSTAGKSLEAAGVSVSLGQNAAARAAVDVMLVEVAQADQIISASTKVAQSFAQDKLATAADLSRLTSRLPQVKTAVDNARRHYVSSTLQVHSNLNGKQVNTSETLEHLLQAAAGPLDSVDNLLQLADAENRHGKVLQAAGTLHDAATQVALAHDQLDRAETHLAAIEAKTRENQAAFTRVAEALRTLAVNQRDPLVTQDTLVAINAAQREVENLNRELATSTAAPNPFEIGNKVDALQQSNVALEARCAADRQANAEASRALAGARRQFQTAQQLVRQSQTDGIPDSLQTKLANDRIASLSQTLALIESQLNTPHGDWSAVDGDASRLQADLSAAAETLGGELKIAGQALSIFQQASQSVFQAEQWSGSYGIRVTGSPGVRELEQARASLQQGNYNQVLDVARFAASAALAAIQQAEREVQRRQLAQEREAEAERRRREAAQRRNTPSFGPVIISGGSSTGGPFGGGSFGGSSPSSGGSSFGSSGDSSGSAGGSSAGSSGGSGFSRSGW